MISAIEEKRNALVAYTACHSERCVNAYWLQLCSKMQDAADTGNMEGMYEGIKLELGLTQNKITNLNGALGSALL